MPFYAGNTRVNLNSASSLYQPADSSGAACNMSSGAATGYYANGSQIYMTTGSWHTIWTGSQSLSYGSDIGQSGTTTISSLNVYITSAMKFKVYVTTTYGNSSWVDEDNEPVSFGESRKVSNKTYSCDSTVYAPVYNNSSSVKITANWTGQSGRLFPSIKATEIQAYY